MRKCRFVIEGVIEPPVEGLNDNEQWNGFACPLFSREQAKIVVDRYNTSEARIVNGGREAYIKDDGSVVFPDDGANGEDYVFPQLAGGLYAIGNFCWGWKIAE